MSVSQNLIENFIRLVVDEDLGRGDLFTRVSSSSVICAYILAKSDGIFAGAEYIEALANIYGLKLSWYKKDGDSFSEGDRVVDIEGDSKDILSLERTILDLALHATSIATLTAKYVAKLEGLECRLLDTRKTRPALRAFEKYAVRCGGGQNHRMGLDDCLMLKDTHLRTIDNLEKFMKDVRAKIPFTTKIEIECEDFDMAKEAMRLGADIVMCDNMDLETIKEVVAWRNRNSAHTLLEASGNVTLNTIRKIATTGVDAISSGSIIHQATWQDLSMKVE